MFGLRGKAFVFAVLLGHSAVRSKSRILHCIVNSHKVGILFPNELG